MDKHNLKQMIKNGYIDSNMQIPSCQHDFVRDASSKIIKEQIKNRKVVVPCQKRTDKTFTIFDINKIRRSRKFWYAGLRLEEFNKINKAGK